MPAVHRLNGAEDALSGGKVEALVANAKSRSACRVAAVAVRYQEDILVDDRDLFQGASVSRRQDGRGVAVWTL